MMSSKRAGQTATWCLPCNVALGPDNPADEHNRTRAHINRLLQLGLELPIADETVAADCNFKDVSLPKNPWCTVCDVSAGETPAQAALHYRSREHINKRLQLGLPVPVGSAAIGSSSDDGADGRDFINNCLRRGALPSASSSAPVRPKGINGKRKLPVPLFGGLAQRSPSGTTVAPLLGFAQEKRACRPMTSVQKVSSDFPVQNATRFATGRQLSAPPHFRQSLSAGSSPAPAGSLYRAPAAMRGGRTPGARSAVRQVAPPPSAAAQWGYYDPLQSTLLQQHHVGLYGDQFGAPRGDGMYTDQCVATDQSSAMYGAVDQHSSVMYPHGAVLNEQSSSLMAEGWFCDLCNIALPTAIALNQHTNSNEHRLAAEWSRSWGQSHALFQQS